MQPHFFLEVVTEFLPAEEHPDSPCDLAEFSAHEFPPSRSTAPGSRRLNDARNGADDAPELRQLDFQLFASRGGQAIVAGAAIFRRRPPVRVHPAFDEHALERWIKRAFLDLQDLF